MTSDPSPTQAPDGGQTPVASQNGHAETDGQSGKPASASGLFSLLLSGLGRAPANLRQTIEDALRADIAGDGTFTDQERGMLLRLLRYGGLRVDDVMVPRADIIAADDGESVANVLRLFVQAGVSRIPLYHETLDDPRGVLHVKDLLNCLVAEAEAAASPEAVNDLESQTVNGQEAHAPAAALAVELSGRARDGGSAEAAAPAADAGALGERPTLMQGIDSDQPLDLGPVDLNRPISSLKVRRDVLFVPPSMPAMSLLIKMQTSRSHMALVVDEYGGTDGLVTIEDLVEEIVGDIEDEHDDEEDAFITEDAGGGLIASARTPVEDLESHVGVKLLDPEDEDDIDTVGGLVFSLIARVPSRGEIIPHPSGIEFEILEADPRRIRRLRIHKANVSNVSGSEG